MTRWKRNDTDTLRKGGGAQGKSPIPIKKSEKKREKTTSGLKRPLKSINRTINIPATLVVYWTPAKTLEVVAAAMLAVVQ